MLPFSSVSTHNTLYLQNNGFTQHVLTFGIKFSFFCQCHAVCLSEDVILPVAGYPTSQPSQSEAALPALLEARSVAVLTAGTDPGHHDAIDIKGSTEWVTSMSLRQKLELL